MGGHFALTRSFAPCGRLWEGIGPWRRRIAMTRARRTSAADRAISRRAESDRLEGRERSVRVARQVPVRGAEPSPPVAPVSVRTDAGPRATVDRRLVRAPLGTAPIEEARGTAVVPVMERRGGVEVDPATVLIGAGRGVRERGAMIAAAVGEPARASVGPDATAVDRSSVRMRPRAAFGRGTMTRRFRSRSRRRTFPALRVSS